MDYKKLVTLLAIFCIIASAGAVCAADVNNTGEYTESKYPSDDKNQENDNHDENEKQERNQQDSDNYTESPDNDTDDNITEVPYDSDYGEGTDEAVNETDLSASEPENATGNPTVPRIMHATGNPILMLVIVAAGLGSAAVLRRK